MSTKHKHKHHPAPGSGAPRPAASAAPGAPAPTAGDEPAAVRQLIAQGKSKPALERAKEHHKRTATADSEALLVEAYLARTRALLENGMREEARAMADLILERYPAARARRVEIDLLFATHGSLEELVRPLAAPETPPPARAAIEEALRRTLTDPAALAACPALPEDHPLRRGAAAVAAALELATRRPARDEEIALPEIPRRSPLAPWKLLLRAIAAFYRQDDEACRRALEAIEPDAAPARLAPALRAMMDAGAEEALTPAARALARQVTGSHEEVRKALEQLDREFAELRPARVIRAIRGAIAAARADAPELLERMRQRIMTRTWIAGAPPEEITAAMGGPPLKTAAYWRLMARGYELAESRRSVSLNICVYWEMFRRHATAEGWFADGGPESAAIYLRMAEALGKHEPLWLKSERQRYLADVEKRKTLEKIYYADQPAAVRQAGLGPGKIEPWVLDPDQLYARACAIEPSAENHRRWLEWARSHSGTDWKDPERVAQAWALALPGDPAPFLELSAMAERRGALEKALRWQEAAMARDPLSPAVRRARLRLKVAAAMRHLKQKKPHLLEKDLAQIEELPQAAEGDRPAFWAALRWLAGGLAGETPEVRTARRAEIAERLGSLAAAEALLGGLIDAGGLKAVKAVELEKTARSAEKNLADAAGRAAALAADLNVSLPLPYHAWEKPMIQELTKAAPQIDPARLRALAEAALRDNHPRLTYAASGAGLALGGPALARFLLLRAKSVNDWLEDRRTQCLTAAITLARRQRDAELVSEIIDYWRGSGPHGLPPLIGLWDEGEELGKNEMEPEHLERLLEQERRSRQPGDAMAHFATMFPDCRCRQCRMARGEIPRPEPRILPPPEGGAFGPNDEDEGGEEDELDDVLEEMREELEDQFGERAPEAVEPLLELLAKNMRPDGTLPDPDEILRNNPELAERLRELMGIGGGDYFSDEFAPPRRNTKTQRKRRKHKK